MQHGSEFLQILTKATGLTLVTVIAMFGLSIGVWTILIRKWLSNNARKSSFNRWKTAMAAKTTFQDLVKQAKAQSETPHGRITQSALAEIEGLSSFVSYDSIEVRSQLVQDAIERQVDRERDVADRGLVFLAFCTATGPLIGLLGTIWGIMEAFFQIGKQGSANITVVAPGIAEALIAVLAGLFVAIPSSLGYNAFAGFNRKAESIMYTFGSELVSLFKRGDLAALERTPRT
jgi:biopolymer transport protein TolQ